MDPIHPILPTPPNIPPVAPAPRLRGVDRDGGGEAGPGGRDRRRPPREARDEPELERPESDGEGPPHIDVTA
jgi:hypothetical protein